jgi:hypothetical protein
MLLAHPEHRAHTRSSFQPPDEQITPEGTAEITPSALALALGRRVRSVGEETWKHKDGERDDMTGRRESSRHRITRPAVDFKLHLSSSFSLPAITFAPSSIQSVCLLRRLYVAYVFPGDLHCIQHRPQLWSLSPRANHSRYLTAPSKYGLPFLFPHPSASPVFSSPSSPAFVPNADPPTYQTTLPVMPPGTTYTPQLSIDLVHPGPTPHTHIRCPRYLVCPAIVLKFQYHPSLIRVVCIRSCCGCAFLRLRG